MAGAKLIRTLTNGQSFVLSEPATLETVVAVVDQNGQDAYLTLSTASGPTVAWFYGGSAGGGTIAPVVPVGMKFPAGEKFVSTHGNFLLIFS